MSVGGYRKYRIQSFVGKLRQKMKSNVIPLNRSKNPTHKP